MIHFLTNDVYVKRFVILYLMPLTAYGKRDNYTKFCKQICNIVQFLSTCHITHEYKINVLEHCFRKLNVGYYANLFNNSMCVLSYKVKDIRHSIDMIKLRLNNRYQTELPKYTLYGKKLIAPAIFDYDMIKSRLNNRYEMELRKCTLHGDVLGAPAIFEYRSTFC